MSSEQAGATPGPGAMSDRMRALLSRAAEEQLHEQRQVSTVLGELRALVADLDERLATGEQVDHVAEQVQALSDRVEERLDATRARTAELAERITDATALVGRAAEDLADAVAARVADRLEARLRALVASVDEQVAASERRLAVHVDDAVLALAEVVLRRGRPAPPDPATAPGPLPSTTAALEPTAAADDGQPDAGPADQRPLDADPQPSDVEPEDAGPADAEPADVEPTDTEPTDAEPTDAEPEDEREDDSSPPESALPDAPPLGHQDHLDVPVEVVQAPPAEPAPGDGFVLVPADVEDAEGGPAPVAQQERRTSDRRAAGRNDGSGRRLRPWWRQV